MLLRIFKVIKDAFFVQPFTLLLQPLAKGFHFLYYLNKLIIWIWKNKGSMKYCDFYKITRRYSKRLEMFEWIKNEYNLQNKKLHYLEFGVASGSAFKWWLMHLKNKESQFFGFDTFEGLPENWGSGIYKKGAMSWTLPDIQDSRSVFLKGLFQDTLPDFLSEYRKSYSDVQKIIHLDADLYSSTLFVLSQLYPLLNKGDLVLFDEFNVPLHEFKAYHDFTKAFYVNLIPIASVNNFYQTAFVVA